MDYEESLDRRFAELKTLRAKFVAKYPELKPRKNGGVTQSARFPYCVWVDFPEARARIAFYEDCLVDEKSGNIHPGRIGYATIFKNLHSNGGACDSPNDIVDGTLRYRPENKLVTGIRVCEENFDEIVAAYQKFLSE